MRIRQFQVQRSVPESLRPLEEIAHNMWQAWNWDAIELFVRLNPAAWERSGQNPVAMLGSLSAEEMETPWFLTQQQRFFISYSTAWREIGTAEYYEFLIATDEHAPAPVRAVQPLRG